MTLYLGINHPVLNDSENNGRNGVNRCAARPQIKAANGVDYADTDVDAVKAWLSLTPNGNTWRQKRKEIERFMLWLRLERQTTLSSATTNDFTDYLKFIVSPAPHWMGKRVPRGPDWRPFEKGLQAASVQQAKVLLADCFTWLWRVRYLDFNITDNAIIKVKQKRNSMDTNRHIHDKLLKWLWSWLQDLPEHDKAAIRWRFAVEFLVSTGLREAELASAKMGDIWREVKGTSERWYITVTGKGDKVRNVPIVRIESLMQYRMSMGLEPLPLIGEETPLWIPLRGSTNVTPAAIYATIKQMVNAASKTLKNLALEEPNMAMRAAMLSDAAVLNAVSPHWFRHSFATYAINEGTSLKHVQIALGHASVVTTEAYVNTEQEQVYDSLANNKSPISGLLPAR